MTTELPQPTPSGPAPPPSEAARRSWRWRNWILGVGMASVFACVLIMVLPKMPRRNHGRDQTETIMNVRQIGLALFEFDRAYGCFPDDSTIAKVKTADPTNTIPLGNSSSNDYFRQLIVAQIAQSETMFFGRTPTCRIPDNVMLGTRALQKGECGFAYIPGYSAATEIPVIPVVLFPLVPGKLIFDYKLCKKLSEGKAVILRADNSVSSYPVDKSGHVYINGKDLFDPSQPFWNGKVPDVKWPE